MYRLRGDEDFYDAFADELDRPLQRLIPCGTKNSRNLLEKNNENLRAHSHPKNLKEIAATME
jgi:hypothetical protein